MPHAFFFFLSSFGWNFGLGMTWLAIPLFAASQGLSNAEIGALVALPILIQAPLNLAGGAYTDRIGGRRIVLASCLIMALAASWFVFARGFWMLLAGQFVMIFSRAAFWPATWAMASELPGERSVQLGRLNALTNFGHIAGSAVCGFVLSGAGFVAAFVTLAGMGLASFAAALGTRGAPPKPPDPRRHVFAGYGPLLRRRVIPYSMLCAYLSALPFSLSLSFYPLLLADFGYGEDGTGVLLGLRALGAIAAGLVAARFVRTGPQTPWPVICGLVTVATSALLPLLNHAALIALWLFIAGLGSGAMTIYFQVTISEASKLEERGSALALGGVGWSISHLSTPLIMGFIADRHGLAVAFYCIGVVGLAATAFVAWARKRAFD